MAKRRKQHKSDFSEFATTNDVALLLAVPSVQLGHLLSRLPYHYRVRERKKDDGSIRILNVPDAELRLLQRKVNDHILKRVPMLKCVLGGVPGKSAPQSASIHRDQQVVFTMDIDSFFPSVSPTMVRRVFRNLKFGEEAVKLLTVVTTFGGELPQGAPTSTPLSNLVLEKADRRIMRLAAIHRFRYSRWVDDLTFSGTLRILGLRGLFQRVIEDEGFRIKPEKTKTMRREQPQVVTKLVVNDKVNVPKDFVRETKRQIHIAIREGQNVSPSTLGRIQWIRSINKKVGTSLLGRAIGKQL